MILWNYLLGLLATFFGVFLHHLIGETVHLLAGCCGLGAYFVSVGMECDFFIYKRILRSLCSVRFQTNQGLKYHMKML
jgi:hypothetical protein